MHVKADRSQLTLPILWLFITTRNAFCGTWYLPHSHVHNERTVPIIMAGCIAHARNGRISTSGENLTSPSCSLTPISFRVTPTIVTRLRNVRLFVKKYKLLVEQTNRQQIEIVKFWFEAISDCLQHNDSCTFDSNVPAGCYLLSALNIPSVTNATHTRRRIVQ